MAINLQKGANTSLTNSNPGLREIFIGLGWDSRKTEGVDFDLDACAFLLGDTGRVCRDEDFIFYNNPASQCSSVIHGGDNRTGDGDGDDEVIKIDLSKVPSLVTRIAICVSIHDAVVRNQNFGMVQNSFSRVVNSSNSEELARFDLSEDFSTETSLIFGEIYRNSGGWKFKAIGQGFSGELENLLRHFGISI